MSASSSKAAFIPGAPKYAFTLNKFSGSSSFVSISLILLERKSFSRCKRSSPSSIIIFKSTASFFASSSNAFLHASRLTPPALLITLMFFSLIFFIKGPTWFIKSFA